MLLPRLKTWLKDEAKELERDFLGEEPFFELTDPLRFLGLEVSSGMNRLSLSLDRRDSRRRANSSAPSSIVRSSSRWLIYC